MGHSKNFPHPPVEGLIPTGLGSHEIPKGQKFHLNDSYRAALKNLHFPKGQFSIEEIPIPRGP